MPEQNAYSAELLHRDAALAEQLAAETRQLASPDAGSPAHRRELVDLAARWLADVAADASRAHLHPIASAARRLHELLTGPSSADLAGDDACLTLLAEGLTQIAALLRDPHPPTAPLDAEPPIPADPAPLTAPEPEPTPTPDPSPSLDANAQAPTAPPQLDAAEPTDSPATDATGPLETDPPAPSATAAVDSPAAPVIHDDPADLLPATNDSVDTVFASFRPNHPPEPAPDEFVDAEVFLAAQEAPAADSASTTSPLPAPVPPAIDLHELPKPLAFENAWIEANFPPSRPVEVAAESPAPDRADPAAQADLATQADPATQALDASVDQACARLAAAAAQLLSFSPAASEPAAPTDPLLTEATAPDSSPPDPFPAAPADAETPEPTASDPVIAQPQAADECPAAPAPLPATPIDESTPPDAAPVDPTATDALAPDTTTHDDPAFPDDPNLNSTGELTPEQMAALMGGAADAPAWGSFPLALEPARVEALQFIIADIAAAIDLLTQAIKQFAAFSTREEATVAMREVVASLSKLVDGFDFVSVRVLRDLLSAIADAALTVPEGIVPELTIRLSAAHSLLVQHVRALEVGMEMRWPLDTFKERVEILLSGRPLHPDLVAWHHNDPDRLIELDLISEGIENPPRPESSVGSMDQLAAASAAAGAAAAGPKDANATVRVPAVVLDALVSMSSQLVLAKNRLVKLSSLLRMGAVNDPRLDELAAATDELAQLSASMQTAMMRARMQPISRLFERYPRVVRDVANLMDKRVELHIAGESTQVDKTVFEGLGEPLTHILRDLVSRWIQTPADREATGLPPTATIKLDAQHLGNQVAVTITHDGYAPDPEPILTAAIAAGVIDEQKAVNMSAGEIFALAYDPDVNDPQQAVVTRALAALRGRAALRMDNGWTTIELTLPLELAIIESVLVGVGPEVYAVPLRHVHEIVKIEPAAVKTVRSRPVFTLRDAVVPILDLSRLVGLEPSSSHTLRFGIIVSAGGDPAALLVDRIVGRQEVVIKPLDHTGRADHSLFAGATIRDDGEVSLVFETERVLAAGASLIA